MIATKSQMVKPPRVKGAPAAFECKYWQTVVIPDADGKPADYVVFGEVVSVFIDDTFVKDGIVDSGAMEPIARLGYMDYGVVRSESIFTINRPMVDEDGNVESPSSDSWDGTYR